MNIREKLRLGHVIPAHPLALNSARKLDERRQRALTRYYIAAGVGGIAVAVHTTQFEIRERGLLRPVLELAAEVARSHNVIKIAGVCGKLPQAVSEAELAKSFGYDAVLLNMNALKGDSVASLLDHVRTIAAIIPVIGFYLQPAAGGIVVPYTFWRQFAEIPNIVAIKIAPFNRYQTFEVVRAVLESGRSQEIALYTGNDDNILVDLLTEFEVDGRRARIVGGLLGHWAVWTKGAVELLARVKNRTDPILRGELTLAQQITDMNASIFDPSHNFAGCIPGIHEVLRRQGLLEGLWTLDPGSGLSPGQSEEIDRVCRSYPHLCAEDDRFIQEHRDAWLRP
ncbi:MAG TPA: dihydrodipicolinate synthase family protein [Alloacidobacterium sp.]|jgi:dihydrodipicolinate synthase/N-acetylneuraminate lyase|nr:dihydrodipicolinate synthase family protein [Alloacidobacterium sp.]